MSLERIILPIVVGYIIGSIPTGLIIGKITRGIDIRKYGSGNIGATNVFRQLGTAAGILVLFLDILKGFLPTFFFYKIILINPYGVITGENLSIAVGLAVILGHSFSLFLKFSGGKGVATSIGIFLALAPLALLIALIISLPLALATGYVSLGSVTGAIVFPIAVIVFHSNNIILIIISLALGLLILLRHRANIQRLIVGKELKVFRPNLEK